MNKNSKKRNLLFFSFNQKRLSNQIALFKKDFVVDTMYTFHIKTWQVNSKVSLDNVNGQYNIGGIPVSL